MGSCELPAMEGRAAAPFVGDELWVLVCVHLADEVRALGRLARVSHRFAAKVVAFNGAAEQRPSGAAADAAATTQQKPQQQQLQCHHHHHQQQQQQEEEEALSVVEEAARRACGSCPPHVASWSPRRRGQPWLRLLWERSLLARPSAFAAVGPMRAAQRTELTEGGAVARQLRMPIGEQREAWASESEPAFALVPAEPAEPGQAGTDAHTSKCVVLEYSQLVVGAVPLRCGVHYMELELLEKGLLPGPAGGLQESGLSTARFGVVGESPATHGAGLVPHALWEPTPELNPLSPWAQFTDVRGRSYYVRGQSDDETAEHDAAQQLHADDAERLELHEPFGGGGMGGGGGGDEAGALAVAVGPTFASEARVLEALSYEAVVSAYVPPDGVRITISDDDEYYYDSIVGEQWFYDALEGDLVEGMNNRSAWPGQRAAKEKDRIGLLLDVDAGTLDAYLNGERLGRMSSELRGNGPFRFAAEIFTDAKVRVVSKEPPPRADVAVGAAGAAAASVSVAVTEAQ